MMKNNVRNKRCSPLAKSRSADIFYLFVISLVIGLFAFSSNAFAWINMQIDPTFVENDGKSKVDVTVTVIYPGDWSVTPHIDPYPMEGEEIVFYILVGEGSIDPETKTTDKHGEAIITFYAGTKIEKVTILASDAKIGQDVCGFVYVGTKVEIVPPLKFIAVDGIANFNAKILPEGLTGEFKWKIKKGPQYAQITAGANSQTVSVEGIEPSKKVDDVTLKLEFKPTGAKKWCDPVYHSFTVIEPEVESIAPSSLTIYKGATVGFQITTKPAGYYDKVDVDVSGASLFYYDRLTGIAAVTFDEASTSATDYKTVTATCGKSSVEAKTIVVWVIGVTFSEPTLPADGTSTVTAFAITLPPWRTISWSIIGNSLGCSINSTTSTTCEIKAGTTGGNITVRASDSECWYAGAEGVLTLYDVTKVKSITPSSQTVGKGTETVFQIETDPAGRYDKVIVTVDGATFSVPYDPLSGKVKVKFDQVSTSATDYKTVTATCGTSSVEAKTIVFEVKRIKFQNSKMGAAWKVVDQIYKFLGVFRTQTVTFGVVTNPVDIPLVSSDLTWSGAASGNTPEVTVTFNLSGTQTIIVTAGGSTKNCLVEVNDRPSGPGEREYAKAHPFNTAIAYLHNLIGENSITLEPFIWANATYHGEQHNTVADAARHAYWTCLLTRYTDAEYAIGITTAHEVSWPGPSTEGVMDLHNNATGVGLASHTHGDDNTCCQNAVTNAISTGILIYLDSSYGATNINEDALLQPTNK